MNLTSYILENALKRLQLPDASIKQFRFANLLSDVNGSGFPKELFQLSAPMVIRGLLNFAVFQMRRDWIFPYWVHKQLDPTNPAYVARSQNPLMINVTHRNWTAIGTPNGFYEAIVDPRGLVTPLPREWSLDVWLVTDAGTFFPSIAQIALQDFDTSAPRLTTKFEFGGIKIELEQFVGQTNHKLDVLFNHTKVKNESSHKLNGFVCIAIRPFNPEGVAPIQVIDFRTRKIAYVDNAVGVVFADAPDLIMTSNGKDGDTATIVRTVLSHNGTTRHKERLSVNCSDGLANAAAMFALDLEPAKEKSVCYSVALGETRGLRRHSTKQTWRVSFDDRKKKHQTEWEQELSVGAIFRFPDQHLQNLFDASTLALLQFHDGEFISPGPYLYHRFWYRDSAPMIQALDGLGFSRRARQVINAFPMRLTSEGFFRGPDGEWDSNGAVLWSVYQHYLFTRSDFWLAGHYPQLLRAAHWIRQMRSRHSMDRNSFPGLMPKSLSAEHLGTVDQYFWDTFWSLAGIQSFVQISEALRKTTHAAEYDREENNFRRDILDALNTITERLGEQLIPATPTRGFDESAIGSICCLYPLRALSDGLPHPQNTVRRLLSKFVDERGFFHPFVHSGYNPYLTMHIAHALLWMNDTDAAWRVANSIFKQAPSPYSLPEAIHPKTGGGAMGDGHHGWAAAEILLFLRDCLIREEGESLLVFHGAANTFFRSNQAISMTDVPTTFGKFSCSLRWESERHAVLECANVFFTKHRPSAVIFYLPFVTSRVVPTSPFHVHCSEMIGGVTRLTCSADVSRAFLEIK